MATNAVPPPLPFDPVDDETDERRFRTAHRGGSVLALGIIGLAVCFICGIIAVVMGSADLREMRAGRMDPTGEGATRAGLVCGIISLCLWGIFIVLAFAGVVTTSSSSSYQWIDE